MRIYLVGFMASGKSTLGARAAAALAVPFVDTDQVVESQAGLSVEQLFESYGEDYFRLLERDVLHQTQVYPKALVATGGGLPMFHDNMEWMLVHGITVYLQWPEEKLLEHVMGHAAGRPLMRGLQGRPAIREWLRNRCPVYDRAAITLELEGDPEADLAKVIAACRYIW